MRRAAVYNRYWPSKGGGERHAAKVAEVLARDGWAVDLVGHAAFDRDDLAEHLALDLSRCDIRLVPYRGDATVAALSESYDLFVNASHMSRVRARARRNVLLCYFPTPLDFADPWWRRLAVRGIGPLVRGRDAFPNEDGWHPPEGGLFHAWAWTNGDAVLRPRARRLAFDVARLGGPATTLRVTDESGRTLATVGAGARFAPVRVEPVDGPVHLLSDTYVLDGESRELGVAVARASTVRSRIARQWPWLLVDPADTSFLASYQLVLANSEFTREWMRRLWHTDAEVLLPPVRVDGIAPSRERDRTIVTVGRFFPPGSGHAKRQHEMVRMFGDLVRAGRLPGWTLHVVGGCEPRGEPYLATVRAAAAGLPVEIHANAPRDVVDALLARGSVFWSATGLGEREDAAPWNQEHFGMTTVEAMAGGCVPVVIDRAGQREIVRDGVDGYRWATPAALGERTVRVATDEALRARLAASAVARAAEFSDAAFERRWRALLGD